jgi:hypothetical protein
MMTGFLENKISNKEDFMIKTGGLVLVGSFIDEVVRRLWDKVVKNYTAEDLWWMVKNSPKPVCNWSLAELLKRKNIGGSVIDNRVHYKVTGRFEVYDRHDLLVTDQLFLNKIFETPLSHVAKSMGIDHMRKRAVKKYGKGATVKQAGNLTVAKSHAPVEKKKKAEKSAQGRLF